MNDQVLNAFAAKLELMKEIVNDILNADPNLEQWEVDVLSIKRKGTKGRLEGAHEDMKLVKGVEADVAHIAIPLAITCFDEDGNPYHFSGPVCPRP